MAHLIQQNRSTWALVVFVLAALAAWRVEAGSAHFQRLGAREGLPQVSVRAIVQDSSGFIWFGTQGGLVRFESQSFRVFRHRPGEHQTLRDNAVWALERDGCGGLWVGTNRGLDRYHPHTERFEGEGTGARPAWANGPIRALLRDSRGRLWVGTQDHGMAVVAADGDLAGARCFRYHPDDPDGLPLDRVIAFAEDSKGLIWLGTEGGGLVVFDPKAHDGFRRFNHDDADRSSLAGSHVEAILEDSAGNLWIGTDAGLDRALRDRGGVVGFEHHRSDAGDPDALADDAVSALAEDSDGRLWVGTRDGGLHRLEPGSGGFERYVNDLGDSGSLSDNDVRSLFVDRQGILWVGTWGAGVNRYDPVARAFTVLRHSAGDPSSLSHNIVLSFLEDRSGAIWVGTWGGGLNRLSSDPSDLEHAEFRRWRHDSGDPHSLAHDTPWPLLEDAAGDLWIGTWGGGLDRLRSDQFARAAPDFEHLEPAAGDAAGVDRIAALFEDSAGRIWIGTWGAGLQRALLGDQRQVVGLSADRHDGDDPQSVAGDYVKAFAEDSRGNLWIGTWTGGLSVLPAAELERSPHRFRNYRPNDATPASGPSHEHILCIHEDRLGRIWIGTYGGGLDLFDPETGQFRFFLEGEGLGNGAVYGILEDDAGRLWLSTNAGLDRFDPETETFLHWDSRDGLAGDEFNQGAWMRSRDGRLWFGGIEGLTVFDPSEVILKEAAPPVRFTDLLLFNRSVVPGRSPVLSGSIGWTRELVFQPGDDVFTFVFSALDYRRPHRVRYEYRLEGFDTDWIAVDNALRRAAYTRVPPGAYKFSVRAWSEDGAWQPQQASVRVVVRPPWWRTWTFKLGLIALVVCGAVGFHVARLASHRRQRAALEREVRSRTAEIAEKNLQLEEQARRLDEMARIDPLTGLSNRRDFLERAEAELARTRRHHRTFCIAIADLDHFKSVNDRHGHGTGDVVLAVVAEAVSAEVRDQDTVARWGGEELILLLPETDLEAGLGVIRRIRDRVQALEVKDPDGAVVRVTLTAGIADQAGHDALKPVIAEADAALYRGKAMGRNQVVSARRDSGT